MVQLNDLNVPNIAMLCALPATYVLLGDYPKVQGMIVGALLAMIISDIQKYGVRAMLILPTSSQVETIFRLIEQGNLDELKKQTKSVPPAQLVKMTISGG